VSDEVVIRAFERDMAAIYDSAKRAGYNATRFLVMIREHGGLETAHRLLASPDVSYGFTELWMLGRQDLTVEALVLKREYNDLFSDAELRAARERLGIRTPSSGPSSNARWTVDSFIRAAKETQPSTYAVVTRFAKWLSTRPEAVRVGEGDGGPLYFAPPSPSGRQVVACAIYLNGELELLFNELRDSQPFDRVSKRVELQSKLNGLVGFEVKDAIVETGTWQRIDAAYLLSPGAFNAFADVYEWVAGQLAGGGTSGQ
jgi:hypothetical protein